MCGGGGDGDGSNDDTTSTDEDFNDSTGVDTGNNNDSDNNNDTSTVGDDSDDDSTDLGGGGSGGSGSSSDGNTFGIDGVSKTGSTSLDAAIGYTNGIGTGQIGNNYNSLNAASASDVNEAITMAQNGATVSQIGDMLGGTAGSSSISESTAGGFVDSGKSIKGYTASGTPVYSTTGRTVTAPNVLSDIVGKSTSNITGGGFSNVTGALTDEDFSGLMSGRTDVTGVQGYDNASKMDDAGMSWGPFGFGPRDLDPFGGRGPNVDINTNVDTGSGRIGLGGTLFGGAKVSTTKSDLSLADMTKGRGYGMDFGLNLGSFMNTPNMAGVTPTEAMAKGNYSPYADWGVKAGGQAPTYGVTLDDYSFNKDGTISGTFSGKNEGFFGSTVGGIFGLITGSPIVSALNTAGTLTNAAKKGAFSTISTMAGMVNPTVGAITTPINAYATFTGKDVDQMMGLGANQGYGTQSTSPSESNDSGTESIGRGPELTSPSNNIRPIERPDTTPRDLIRGVGRRKRRAGEDVYGMAGSSPFLSYSDDIDTSGIGSFSGSARSGQFKQAPTGR